MRNLQAVLAAKNLSQANQADIVAAAEQDRAELIAELRGGVVRTQADLDAARAARAARKDAARR